MVYRIPCMHSAGSLYNSQFSEHKVEPSGFQPRTLSRVEPLRRTQGRRR
jgi:hypothetical protein